EVGPVDVGSASRPVTEFEEFVVPGANCFRFARLSPFWVFDADAVDDGPAAASASRPTNASELLSDAVRTVSTSLFVEVFDASTDVAPPETTPMTSPATALPVVEEAVWSTLSLLLPV